MPMDNQIEDIKAEAVEYVVLLEQLGIDDQDIDGHMNRANLRFQIDLPEKSIRLQIGNDMCVVHDVSVGGLSFNSINQYEVGQQIGLTFDGRYNVDVVIVDAQMDNAASNEEETFFRHGAEFELDGDAYKCTIAVLNYFLEVEKE